MAIVFCTSNYRYKQLGAIDLADSNNKIDSCMLAIMYADNYYGFKCTTIPIHYYQISLLLGMQLLLMKQLILQIGSSWIRWVNNDYEVSEDSVGFHCYPNTTSDTLYNVVTDILTQCTLPLALCKRLAFDGAANMQGKWNRFATKVRNEVPGAVPVHCLAHCINLCFQDAGHKLLFLRDAIDTVREIAKLIKFSPKKHNYFQRNWPNLKI